MSDLSSTIETLRKWRENNERNSREVIEKWYSVLEKNVDKLGADALVILEQVCLASLDCYEHSVARSCVTKLYKQFPDSLRVRKLEAMTYESVENYEGALIVLNDIIKQDATNSSARKRTIAILKAQNKIPEAIKELVEYLKIYMADAEAWQELSELYLTEHDYSKASFCVEELLLHNPHNHLLHQRYADIKYTQGGFDNLELARAYYCQALKLNPKNLRAMYGLFMVASSLANSSKSSAQKKKENTLLAQWASSNIKKVYADAEVDDIEDKIASIQL